LTPAELTHTPSLSHSVVFSPSTRALGSPRTARHARSTAIGPVSHGIRNHCIPCVHGLRSAFSESPIGRFHDSWPFNHYVGNSLRHTAQPATAGGSAAHRHSPLAQRNPQQFEIALPPHVQ
jgi:hypothetical protein